MLFAATWMKLETLILSAVSQKEKDKYHIISFVHGIFFLKGYKLSNYKFTKQKQTHRYRKQTYGYQRKKGVGINQESEISGDTLLHIKQISNKKLLYATGNSIQHSVITYNRKESKKE